MFFFKYSFIYITSIWLSLGACHGANSLKAHHYIIIQDNDETNNVWSNYLYKHLSSRTKDITAVQIGNRQEFKKININDNTFKLQIVSNLEYDYVISKENNSYLIQVKNDRTIIWIIYQLIENIASEDNRFTADDLPPSIINFKNKSVKFDFEYREPFFRPNTVTDYSPILGNNFIENDWGLWGHNLSKIIKDTSNKELYALVNGKRNPDQYSFSSPALFKQISDYIINNFGDGSKKSYRFMILPNDNDIVCLCEDCKKMGNTIGNATPSVMHLIQELSIKFPNHLFFTTAYKTTVIPPSTKLPGNAGILLSTIDLPKGINISQGNSINKFKQALQDWQKKTSRIYIWDYAANFDDYLSPLPILFGLQKQLKFFKKEGVTGIFLNGSGYDYSPFDDIKCYVSSALMMDVNANIDSLCAIYFHKEYPASYDLLTHYYLKLEHLYNEKNVAYDMYGSMNENLNSYLNKDEFIHFYEELKKIMPQCKGEEKKKVEKLFTALSYTRLQIAYIQSFQALGYLNECKNDYAFNKEILEIIHQLENYSEYPDMQNYKEVSGSIKDYLKEWQSLETQKYFQNKLINVPISINSNPDEGFTSPLILQDASPGFAEDYHQGWYLSSIGDLDVSFPVNNLKDAQNISMRFLIDNAHHIYEPEKIMLFANGHLINVITQKDLKISGKIASCDIKINFSNIQNAALKIVKKKNIKSIIACDEIKIL